MENNSIILFSAEINSKYLHKIKLKEKKDSNWLGITFRLSKTFIKFRNEIPYFENGIELSIADKNEMVEFYK